MSLVRDRNILFGMARRFKAHADAFDQSFVETCDPRALEGGARCEEAEQYRKAAQRLFDLAEEMSTW